MSESTQRPGRWLVLLLIVIALVVGGEYVFLVRGHSPLEMARHVATYVLRRGRIAVRLPAEAGALVSAVTFSESGERREGSYSEGEVAFTRMPVGSHRAFVLLRADDGRFHAVQQRVVLPRCWSSVRLVPATDGPWPEDGEVAFRMVGRFGRTLGQADISVGPPDFMMGPKTRRGPSGCPLLSSTGPWNVFEHVPYDENGRNPLVLPFHAASHKEAARKHEALAFSLLLSNALDWYPGCWTTRHAYFIFKSSPYEMSALSSEYEPVVIRSATTRWRATHAVGGTLRRHPDGQFSGTLCIFNPNGRTAFEKSLDRPRGYFDLLGDMAAETMTFMGYEPSPALVAHLKQPRCVHPESIEDLGRTAFLAYRSAEEYRLHRRILDRDPDFAEVRHSNANLGYLETKDTVVQDAENAKALRAYLFPAAFSGLGLRGPNREEMIALFESWLERVKALQGGDTPLVLREKWRLMAVKRQRRSADFLRRAIAVAARYPAEVYLLQHLANDYANEWAGPADAAMAAGLYLAALKSPQHVVWDWTRRLTEGLASSLGKLGHNEAAVDALLPVFRQSLRRGSTNDVYRQARSLGWQYNQLCCHLESAGLNLMASETAQPEQQERLVTRSMLSCYMGREDEILARSRSRHAALFSLHAGRGPMMRSGEILRVAEALLAGRPEETATFLPRHPQAVYADTDGTPRNLSQLQVTSMTELMEGRCLWRPQLARVVRDVPDLRILWILFDGYDRQSALPESAAFYEALGWLHGEDPWVARAVADRELRLPGRADVDVEALLQRRTDVSARPWPVLYEQGNGHRSPSLSAPYSRLPPGTIACVVKRLIERGDFDTGEDLCQRWLVDWSGPRDRKGALRRHVNYLYHRVQRARRAVSSPPRDGVVPVDAGGLADYENVDERGGVPAARAAVPSGSG